MAANLLVLGANSLVGSDFVVGASERFSIVAAGRTDPRALGLPVRKFQPLDLSEESEVRRFLSTHTEDAGWVNFAARTDVDGCEAERPRDAVETSQLDRPDTAWRLNASLPGWVAEEAERHHVPFLHLSTDFVFDGSQGPYPEEAEPSELTRRIGWYGYTKGVGEGRVRSSRGPCAVVRISYPYRTAFPAKPDFARNLLDRARTGRLYPLYTDQEITPTWIPDVTKSLLALLDAHASGTFHVASPQGTTPFQFAEELFRVFRVEHGPLVGATLAAPAPGAGKAPRPLHGGLKVRRILELGVSPTGFRDGIIQMAAAHESPH